MRFSLEVQNILTEARDMAAGASQPLTTGHLLLGMLTNANRAGGVLTDLRVDADRVLEAMAAVKRSDRKLEESEELLALIEERMLEAARRSDARLVSSLHLLMALTREKRAIAYRIFALMGLPPAQVRTHALGRITGPVPRSMVRTPSARAFAGEPTGGAVAVAEADADVVEAAPRAKAPTRPAAETSRPPPAPRPRADEDDEGAGYDGDDELDAVRRSRRQAADSEEVQRHLLDPDTYPLLTSLGRNLTAEAAAGRIDPVVGRDGIIDAMIDVLNKRRSNNPCLVGAPGVGKTAIVEGLAVAMLQSAERVAALRDRVVVSIDVGSLVAGTELRGSFSRRMARLKDEVRAADGRVIVFIDELHTLVGAGSGDGALDASNDLKAALARGEFPCIGATTPQEYHRYIERDPALERRFQPIEVDEPSEADTLRILAGIVAHYEAHHGVMYQPDALEAAVRLSRRYIVDRQLPDKAINLIDTAAARAVRHGKETVEAEDVARVVSEVAQIPIERLLMSDAERMLAMRDYLGERIIGHDEVLDGIAEVIQRNSAGFASKRPIGSFLFLGSTGVGKTETAKVLAEFLFGSKDAMTRFDMSELMERHAVSRLLGAAPGYVGHEDAGQLTAALARRPYQIILFDEIEKAHADVLNILLQILDEGHVTDAKGRQLSLSNTVIVMTSNLGAEVLEASATKRIGFGGEGAGGGRVDRKDLNRLMDVARRALPPELWGRIDEKCAFAPLGRPQVAAITRLLIAESSDRLGDERNIRYEVSDEVVEHLIDAGGFDLSLGARPMRRAVQRVCETAIARAILRGLAAPGDRLRLVHEDGEVRVTHVDAAD